MCMYTCRLRLENKKGPFKYIVFNKYITFPTFQEENNIDTTADKKKIIFTMYSRGPVYNSNRVEKSPPPPPFETQMEYHMHM